MAEYRISGVWKHNGVITHYAVHRRLPNNGGGFTIHHAIKMSKAETVALLDNHLNTANTYLWNYTNASWYAGGEIHVVNGTPRFLRTNHDGQIKDNLSHLPDYGYIFDL